MDEGVDAKELLLKHLLATKEIESREEFLRFARKQFSIGDHGAFKKRGNINFCKTNVTVF